MIPSGVGRVDERAREERGGWERVKEGKGERGGASMYTKAHIYNWQRIKLDKEGETKDIEGRE